MIKDASLTESQKTAKTNEYQTLLKEMTNAQFIMQMGNPMAESDEGAQQVSILSTFNSRIFRTNVILAAFSSYILALGRNSYEKFVRRMLMKLTAGVNFINI